ncbi:Inositol 2-dehydrogenase/D-chiro-inositol 3-dehydrogenase [subsurface metagenome]
MDEQSGRDLCLAFIGAGEWVEKYHLPALRRLSRQQGVSVAGIWNRTRAKAEKLAADFSLPKVYGDLQEAADDPAINCFAVAVNSQAVGEILRTLAARNLPVICEKPPGRDGDEALQLAQRITATNVVAFNRRYMPINQQFKELIDRERIEFVECSFYRRQRDVERFVTETGIHGINLLEYLFGDIARVETERWKVAGSSTYNWLASLRFSSGLRGLIKFFPFAGVSLEKVEVNGRDITASVQTAHPFTDAREGAINIQKHGANGRADVEVVEQKDLEPLRAGGFEGEYLDLFEAIRKKRETVSNFQNAWRSVVVAEAVQQGAAIQL